MSKNQNASASIFGNPSMIGSESILSLGDDSEAEDTMNASFGGGLASIVTAKDNQPVNCAKLLVFSFLIVSAFIVSGVTYLFTKRGEDTRFEATVSLTFVLVDD